MLGRILAWVFPPVLPGKVRDWEERTAPEFHEEGWAGKVTQHYKDGIDRHFAEQDLQIQAEIARQQAGVNFSIDLQNAAWRLDLGEYQRLAMAGPPKK
jgi:hypothetical protein